jgi:hypothetical protein
VRASVLDADLADCRRSRCRSSRGVSRFLHGRSSVSGFGSGIQAPSGV